MGLRVLRVEIGIDVVGLSLGLRYTIRTHASSKRGQTLLHFHLVEKIEKAPHSARATRSCIEKENTDLIENTNGDLGTCKGLPRSGFVLQRTGDMRHTLGSGKRQDGGVRRGFRAVTRGQTAFRRQFSGLWSAFSKACACLPLGSSLDKH